MLIISIFIELGLQNTQYIDLNKVGCGFYEGICVYVYMCVKRTALKLRYMHAHTHTHMQWRNSL